MFVQLVVGWKIGRVLNDRYVSLRFDEGELLSWAVVDVLQKVNKRRQNGVRRFSLGERLEWDGVRLVEVSFARS